MAKSSILLLESDAAAGTAISGVLAPAGYAIEIVADPDHAVQQAAGHDLVIIDVVPGPTGPQDVCREIRTSPALGPIPVLCIGQTDDVEQRIHFLEAGADDVMAKPFDARELEARVEALLLRVRRSRGLAPPVPAFPIGGDGTNPHRAIACFSPKGGAGTTTIAVNIATAIATVRQDHVAIVDLDLEFGQVATHLNVTPTQTLAEMSRDEQAIREPELIRTYTTRHDSSLQVLAAPATPDLADLITPEQIRHLLPTLRTAFDLTVIDAGSTLDERTLTLFEGVDSIVIPIYPEIAALKALRSLIDYLAELGTVAAKSAYVVNHIFAREMLRMRDVESALGAKVTIELPYDPIIYLKAVNEGIPVVHGAPRTAPAEKLQALARSLTVDLGDVPETRQTERRTRGLGGLLRRA